MLFDCLNSPTNNHKNCRSNHNIFYPQTRWEWFKLWFYIVVIITIIFLLINCWVNMENQLLCEEDVRQYMYTKESKESKESNQFKCPTQSLPTSQTNANIYALTHNPSQITNLSSDQLLNLPAKYTPTITDFVEDDQY